MNSFALDRKRADGVSLSQDADDVRRRLDAGRERRWRGGRRALHRLADDRRGDLGRLALGVGRIASTDSAGVGGAVDSDAVRGSGHDTDAVGVVTIG